MKRIAILPFIAITVSGCEPVRGIASEQDVKNPVNIGCVDKTLRQTFGKIGRWDYVDDGSTFPKGTSVAQFAYYKYDDGVGWAKLEIGRVGDKTRIAHSFTGIGAKLSQQSFPPAILTMSKAAKALHAACGLDLSGMKLESVGQSVDALN